MDIGKLRVGIGKVEPDRTLRLGPATTDFRKRVFEAIGHLESHAMLGPGHRMEARRAPPLGYARDRDSSLAGFDVGFEFDPSKNRLVELLEGRGEHLEDRRARLGILPSKNPQQ